MVYKPQPPYEILQNKLLDFGSLQKLRRFARYWDLVGNSGNFVETAPLLWAPGSAGIRAGELQQIAGFPATTSEGPVLAGTDAGAPRQMGEGVSSTAPSPFAAFMRWSEWLRARVGRTDSIALVRLMELLFEYLTRELNLNPQPTAQALWRDYQRGGQRDKPLFLKEFLPREVPTSPRAVPPPIPKRQARRNAASESA